MRILDALSQSQEDLEKLYGKQKPLERAKSFDEIVSPSEKYVIEMLERQNRGNPRCPGLRREGRYFYYCGTQAEDLLKQRIPLTKRPSLRSCQVLAKLDQLNLQLWCFRGKLRYTTCPTYPDPYEA